MQSDTRASNKAVHTRFQVLAPTENLGNECQNNVEHDNSVKPLEGKKNKTRLTLGKSLHIKNASVHVFIPLEGNKNKTGQPLIPHIKHAILRLKKVSR